MYRRIATDLYSYYGEIEYKNKSMLKTACKLYIKEVQKYTFITKHSEIFFYGRSKIAETRLC